MLLAKKIAVVYGAGGAVGGAVASAFAREGATVHLVGRTRLSLDAVADRIREDEPGAGVHVARVDATDELAVERHAAFVVESSGGIDISFNAIGNDHFQGNVLTDMSLAKFRDPLAYRLTAQFLTARAAGRRMLAQSAGVIMMISATPARLAIPLSGSFGVACAATESLCRGFAAELGPHGIRVLCLRSAGSPDAPGLRLAFEAQAKGLGVTPSEVERSVAGRTLLKRLPRLAEVADTAAFMASDHASALTATVVNLTSGEIAE